MTIRFFQVGFSYQAQVRSAQGDDVGLLVAVDVGDLDLVAAGKVGVDDATIECSIVESGQ